MNTLHKISIIVPIHNMELHLRECIDSLVNQTYKNIEIILINDGSTDASGEICDEYKKTDSRIKTYHIKNSGPSKARNYGLERISGDYVMFVDSDDWIDYNTIEKCYKISQIYNSDIVLFNLCDFNHTWTRENIVLNGNERYFEGKEIEYIEDIMLSSTGENLVSTVSIGGPVCKLYKRDILYNCFFPINISFGEDTCFVSQVLQNTKSLVYLNAVFYHRRLLQNSLSQAVRLDYPERVLAFVNWILEFYKEKKAYEILNSFCWGSYCCVVNKVIGNNEISFFEKKRLIREFIDKVEFSYDFNKIDVKSANKNMKRIQNLIKKNKLFWVWIVIKLAYIKDAIIKK